VEEAYAAKEVVESIREWYRKTTKKSLVSLWWAAFFSSIGAVLFYVFAPPSVHLKLQVFNGAITIPVAGAIWIVSFILLWLVPMRETAFRSQESMERMESRFLELQKKAESAIGKVETAADKVNKMIDDGVVERVEGHMKAIRERIERDTKPLENPRRRDRSAPLADPEPPAVSLEDVERMEDALNAGYDGDGQGT
jgi:hypothetical protein